MRFHSYISPKCKISASKLGGKGVFAIKKIKKNEMVALWGGIVYSRKEIQNLDRKFPHIAAHALAIYKDFYLGPINNDKLDDAELFNHSCEPNIGVKGQIVVLAKRDILCGEELCFDYDTTDTNDDDFFVCSCKSKFCRKKINGSAWKDKKFVKRNKGFISWYIEEKISKLKKDGKHS